MGLTFMSFLTYTPNDIITILFILLIFLLIQSKLNYIDSYIKKNPKVTKFNYNLFYSDEKINDENVLCSKLLKSNKYGLKGKPDYILKHKKLNKYIPIELKSGKIANKNKPREGDLMQLVTYFLIIEDLYDSKPNYGYLVYKDYMFIVKNSKKLKKELLKTIDEMKYMEMVGKPKQKSEVFYPKCRLCKYRKEVCELHKN